MRLTAHQPAYLPWLGYFEKIHSSDIFVYLDSVQFEKNSFTNRNKIKTPQGELWLTIPVRAKGHISATMETLEIENNEKWRKKHLGAIHANYKKAKCFDRLYPQLEELYARDFSLLSDLCWEHLKFWMGTLGLEHRMVRSSTLPIRSSNTQLIFDLCQYFGADAYISGALGRNYLDSNAFKEAGIEVSFQNYKHPVYPQLWGGDFQPYLSILDFSMNGGEPSTIWSNQE
jgi:hypothetical protein